MKSMVRSQPRSGVLQRRIWRSGFLVCGVLLLAVTPICAQVVPDETLGEERSRLTPNVPIRGANGDLIQGGAQRSGNLFHSFREFNVSEGQRLFFANPTGVQNILTRVTGNTGSNILGTLGVNGNANLFLLNPNGILFGPNAQLDVRGSFVGSTANAIQFGDQGEFRATNPNAPTLLTVNPSALLFNQLTARSISTQPDTFLEVPAGNSFVLLGGDINLDTSTILASGGRVELGSVAGEGSVGLDIEGNAFRLKIPDALLRGNVSLDQSLISVAKVGDAVGSGGDLSIDARNINLSGSFIQAGLGQNSEISGSGQAGDITLKATETTTLSDFSRVTNTVQSGSTGKGGNLTVDTGSLLSTDGNLTSILEGQGEAGNVTINARNTVDLKKSDVLQFFSTAFIGSFLNTDGVGQPGTLTINTGSLSLSNGAFLGSDLSSIGRNSGDIIINARDSVTIDGTARVNLPSGIFSGASFSSERDGGDLTITTGSLFVLNGGFLTSNVRDAPVQREGDAGDITINARDQVVFRGSLPNFQGTATLNPSSSSTAVGRGAQGEGGNLNITTGSLFVSDGAILDTQTAGAGNAGNITIHARNQVSIDGKDFAGNSSGLRSNVVESGVGRGGDINITAESLSMGNQAFLISNTAGQGNAGDINITTRSLSLDDRSIVSAITSGPQNAGKLSINASDSISLSGSSTIETSAISNSPSNSSPNAPPPRLGKANDIDITTRSLKLDQASTIASATTSGNGGNLRFNIDDVLLLRRNSRITTTAGIVGGGGDGGNIDINSPFLVAIPQEDSNIDANAFTGQGGNIRINAQNIFGIQARSQPTTLSDITASSQLGVPGEVTIDDPNVQPTQGTIELPTDVIDASSQVAQVCPRGTAARPLGAFVVSGRGSVPPSPIEPLAGKTEISPLATIEASRSTPPFNQSSTPDRSRTPQASKTIPALHTPVGIAPPEMIEAQGWVKTENGKVALVAAVPKTTPTNQPTASACSTTRP